MELYYVLSILDRNRAPAMMEVHKSLQLSVAFTRLGAGTATSEQLRLHDLVESEKAIISTVASGPTVKQLIRLSKRKLFIDIPGNGIMMVIPMKSMGGGRSLAYLTDGQTLGGAVPEMKFDNELIIVIVNEGFSDMVMDVARAAGATGGTVLHAKGTGQTRGEKFFGVSLAEEKDMIYILASAGKKSNIMKSIAKDCGSNTPACAICFSLPVSEVAGIRNLEDEE